jgi:hypothetical protein
MPEGMRSREWAASPTTMHRRATTVLNVALRLCRSWSDAWSWPLASLAARGHSDALGVPPHLLLMLFLVEDKRFEVHPGVDLLAVLRAALANLRPGQRLQGASTITQQLYSIRHGRTSLQHQHPLAAKVRQASWAVLHDLATSKGDILREYLQTVYCGRSYYGLHSAAWGYFRRKLPGLTVAQSFFLVERIASPNVVRLGRVLALLSRKRIATCFAPADWPELIGLYDQRFGIGDTLWLSLERSLRMSAEPIPRSSLVL